MKQYSNDTSNYYVDKTYCFVFFASFKSVGNPFIANKKNRKYDKIFSEMPRTFCNLFCVFSKTNCLMTLDLKENE
jgi:hypothetical protein